MAYLSEPMPSPMQRLISIWNSWSEIDLTQWQWKAPKQTVTKDHTKDPRPPSWNLPQIAFELAQLEGNVQKRESRFSTHDRIVILVEKLRRSRPDDAVQICQDFRQDFVQHVTLGVISEKQIVRALGTHARSLSHLHPDLQYSECFSFYKELWEGFTACKVLSPADFEGLVQKKLLALLSALPTTSEVFYLAHRILRLASVAQLSRMETGLYGLILKWARSLPEEVQPHYSGSSLVDAQQAVSHAEEMISQVRASLKGLANGNFQGSDLTDRRRLFKRAKLAVNSGITAVSRAEGDIIPSKAATAGLALVLGCLPPGMLVGLVDFVSTNLSKVGQNLSTDKKHKWYLLYCWLSVVAKLPKQHSNLLIDTWKKLGAQDLINSESLCSDLILDDWTRRSFFTNATKVRNTFEAAASQIGGTDLDFGLLFCAIDKCRERHWDCMRSLFQLLNDLGRFSISIRILRRMHELNILVPGDVIGPAIETMSGYNSQLALDMYHMSCAMGAKYTTLRLETTPNFILSLINNRSVHPASIWKLLNIAVYESMPPAFRAEFSTVKLSPKMIDLITRMAISFARSDRHRPRVALRNVMNCLHHLRRHNAPIATHVTRSLIHAGITRELITKFYVSHERLQWALSLVEPAEGTEVAEKLDDIVSLKNQVYYGMRIKGKQRKYRDRNVLRVGPID